MKSFYLLLIAAAICFTACRTKEGAPGPAGESSLNKQGSLSGTITYTDENGNNATTPFSYQYYESLADNKFVYEIYNQPLGYYDLDFKRRDLKDANNFIDFDIEGDASNGIEDDPYSTNANFSLFKIINNELYEFYGDEFDITNVSLDHNTGRVTFDFSGTVYDADDNEATVAGKADITLVRMRENISF